VRSDVIKVKIIADKLEERSSSKSLGLLNERLMRKKANWLEQNNMNKVQS
jgi:hypothetical protein